MCTGGGLIWGQFMQPHPDASLYIRFMLLMGFSNSELIFYHTKSISSISAYINIRLPHCPSKHHLTVRQNHSRRDVQFTMALEPALFFASRFPFAARKSEDSILFQTAVDTALYCLGRH